MSKERVEIFKKGITLESQERVPFRPLEGLSNFIIEELPSYLTAIREEQTEVTLLEEKLESLTNQQLFRINRLAALAEDKGERENPDLLVTRLDLVMARTAVLRSGGSMGPILSEAVNKIALATNRPAGPTYEDVVINNPIDDIRTFTNGEVGESEASFYNGHRYIEEELEPSVVNLYRLLNSPELGINEITTILENVVASLEVAIHFTRRITDEMPVTHFKGVFRTYLQTHPGSGILGPSGAFSPRVPLIEQLLMGETISEPHFQQLLAVLSYFPLTHQQNLVDSMTEARQGKSVKQLLEARPNSQSALELIPLLSLTYKKFRGEHLRAVRVHLPEVFEGKEKGTGGTEIDYLKERKDRTHGLNGHQK